MGKLIIVVCAPILSDKKEFSVFIGMPLNASALTDIIMKKKVGRTGYSTVSVAEQSSATDEIATNISQASQGLIEVDEHVNHISAMADGITQDVNSVSTVSVDISNNGQEINNNAEALYRLASSLKKIVNSFKV